MWDFILGPEGVGNRQINLLWLGMNPKFYQNVLKDEKQSLNHIEVPKVCEEISHTSNELSLSKISNLLKGLCMVHKAQVDFLYSETQYLTCLQMPQSFDIYESDDRKKGPKQKKLNQSESKTITDFSFLLEDTFEETNLTSFDEDFGLNVQNEQNITLKEIQDTTINTTNNLDDGYDEDFEELSVYEKDYFKNISSKQKNNQPHNKNSFSHGLEETFSENNFEISFGRARGNQFNSKRDETLLGNIDDNIARKESYTLPELNNNDFDSISLPETEVFELPTSNLILHTPENNQINNVVELPNVPDYNDFLRNVTHNSESSNQGLKRNNELHENEEIVSSKRFKMDKTIELSFKQITSNLYNRSIFRFGHPAYDIVPKRKFKLMTSEYLLSNPATRSLTTQRNCFKRKIKKETTDFSILNDFLNEIEIEENFSSDMGIKRRRLTQVRTSTREKINHQNEIDENAINFEKEFLDTSRLNSNLNGLQNGHVEETIENIENVQQRTINNNDISLTLKVIKKNWGLKGVLKKLSAIWNSSAKRIPITMEVLCENANKQEAVVAFSTLLHLSAKRYVVLIKDMSTNFIADIKPGKKESESFLLPKKRKKIFKTR